MGLPGSLPKTGLYPRPFGFVWFSYKRTHRRTTAGPMGHPHMQGLASGKDQVHRTTLGPPTNAGGGGVRVNLVQTGWWLVRVKTQGVAQSAIGLVNTGPDRVSEPKEVEYLTQRTSTDTPLPTTEKPAHPKTYESR
jgi:hypothetical protein